MQVFPKLVQKRHQFRSFSPDPRQVEMASFFFHQFGGQTRSPLFSREKEHEYSKSLRDIADIKVPMLPTSVTLTEVHRPSCLIFLRLSGMSNL